VRSTYAGSVVGGKRGACLPSLVGGLSFLRKVRRLKQATITHDDSATLTWLGEALEYARRRNQAKLVGHLGEVLDDVVFEMESVARR